ncbi:MAG: hypothetical protein ACRCX7_11190 [Cetobacterium sp.]|uniref:hypothetical protein n=1 Tax=Cetobacterium sp. TaxID=2071632 RepID=UPI003F3261B3
MRKKMIFSWIAYDHHGEVIGFVQNKPSGEGMFTVYVDGVRPAYIRTSEVGRYETYSLQTINKISKEKQEAEFRAQAQEMI